MGLFGSILNALARLVCGGNQQEQQEPQYPQEGKPSYAQQAQHQQQAQYPPQQQQQQHQKPHHQQQPHKQQHQQQPYHQQQQPHQQQQQPHIQQQRPPRRQNGQVDANQVNQSNPHYTDLRDRARKEGDAMARAFDASHKAYESGEKARAKELSNEGHAHQAEMEKLNREASEWIFRENNTDSQPGEIDLHGLFVKESIEYTDRAIVEAQQRGDSEIQLIVGKGIHSQGGHAKIKPAIEELMHKHNLTATLDPDNAGVLIVQLKSGGAVDRARERGAPVLGADDLSRKLDSRDDGCIIM
ncbi:DUF1771-domain-containing protein [Peniophora sp. CONT]|nr:DUF1771-domain-containing protein [Peniophora sp. CONT]